MRIFSNYTGRFACIAPRADVFATRWLPLINQPQIHFTILVNLEFKLLFLADD